jgi:thiamine-phosphate diphosphorylase
VVNDRADIAAAIGADGLHIGQSDLPLEAARRVLGSAAFIGVSAGTVAEAREAAAAGADYIGAGPVFPTASKPDAGDATGIAVLRAICAAVPIPVVAIGGITPLNAPQVLQAGAVGVAVISAILSQPNINAAAAAFR